MSTLVKTEKIQTNIVYLFIGIWICALIGFHKTYTVFFPSFNGFQWEQHFHGIMLSSWFLMLVVQPFLIRFGKTKTHRRLGKLGYVLAPLVCFSIFLVTKMVYHRDVLKRPADSVLAVLSLSIPEIFAFGLFFALAMINRKDSAVHMRYMVGTSLLMIGPGLGRALIVFGGIPFPTSVQIIYFVAEAVALFLLFNDWRNRANLKPLLTILAVIIFMHLLWNLQNTGIWLGFARWFAAIAY